MSDKKRDVMDRFVSLWYAPSVNTIEDFKEVAHADAVLDFRINKEDVYQTQKLRQKIERYVLNLTPEQRRDANAKPRLGKPYSKFVSRRADGSDKKWHVRSLPSRNRKGADKFEYTFAEFKKRNPGADVADW